MSRSTTVTMETHAMLVEAMLGMQETGLFAHINALTWPLQRVKRCGGFLDGTMVVCVV
jgi:hypothetical protein